MARKYQPYPLQDISLGLDTYSPKDKIAEGALSDVLNMDPSANGTLSTRKGYARHYGNIPLRVNSIEYAYENDVGKWIIQVDAAQTVTFANSSPSPLIVAGELSKKPEDTISLTAGDFSTDTITSIGHKLRSGDAIQITADNAESSLPALLSSITYYVIKTGDDTFKLATTKANSLDEPAVFIADFGTGAAGTLTLTRNLDGELDFSTSFGANWYPSYTLPFREAFTVDGNGFGTKTKEVSDTGFTSVNAMYGFALSPAGASNSSNIQLVFPDSYISSADNSVVSNYEIYNNEIIDAGKFDGYFFYKELLDNPGISYIHIEESGGSDTWSILNENHNLFTQNFVVRCYIKEGANYQLTIPEDTELDRLTGNLTIKFKEAVEGRAMIYAVSSENAYERPPPEGNQTLHELVLGGINNEKEGPIDNPFNIISVWVSSGAVLQEVVVADIEYDYPTKSLKLTYQYPAGTSPSEAVRICVLGADFRSNVIEVTAKNNVDTAFVDENPRLCVWGIEHDNIYREAALRGGHIHHIDSYKAANKQSVIAGLGGNLYETVDFDLGQSYLMSQYVVRGSGRVFNEAGQSQTIRPLFGEDSKTGITSWKLVSVDNTDLENVVYTIEIASENITNLNLTAASFVDNKIVTTHSLTSGTAVRITPADEESSLPSLLSADANYYVIQEGGSTTELKLAASKADALAEPPVPIADFVGEGGEEATGTFTLSRIVSLEGMVADTAILTVSGCEYEANNGTFRIKTSTEIPDGTKPINQYEFIISNSKARKETGIAAVANVFYDSIVFAIADSSNGQGVPTDAQNATFVPGDKMTTGSVDTAYLVDRVEKDNGSVTVYFSNVTGPRTFADGIQMYSFRNSRVLPLSLGANEKVENFVRGDSVVIDGYSQPFTVTQVNTLPTKDDVTVRYTETYKCYEIDLGERHNLVAGNRIIINDADATEGNPAAEFLDGEWVLNQDSTDTILRFDVGQTIDTEATTTLIGNTIELAQPVEIITGPASVRVRPQGRWVPIESPPLPLLSAGAETRVPGKEQRHFDERSFTNQPYIKSTTVKNSMFLTNDADDVKKFDGSYVYSAGVPPFQGWAFASDYPEGGGLPAGKSFSYTVPTSATDYIQMSSALLDTGDRVQIGTQKFTVSAVAANKDLFDVYLAGLTAEFEHPADNRGIKADIYRYYVRYSSVDRNLQESLSATLGAEDLYVEVFDSSNVQLKILAMPAYKGLDHAFIDVEIFRTVANAIAPFYRVAQYRLDYETGAGYIVHEDSRPDISIADTDPVSTLLAAGELGTRLNAPPKAKVMTTADNRLVLGNISSPPILDLAFRKSDTVQSLNPADFNGDTVTIKKAKEDGTTANQELTFKFVSDGEKVIQQTLASFESTAVSVSNDKVVINDHGLADNTLVALDALNGGSVPGGLEEGTVYYLQSLNDNDVGFAASVDGDLITLTSQGSGTIQIYSPDIEVFDGYAEITSTNHGIPPGSWVYFFHSNKDRQKDLRGSGWYRVDSVVDVNTFKISTKHQQVAALGTSLDVDRYVTAAGGVVPVWIGDDGNFTTRNENLAAIEQRAATRLSLAINCIMATENAENSYWTTLASSPSPWLLAQGGNSYPTGQLRVYQTDAPDGELSVTHAYATGKEEEDKNYQFYVNNLDKTGSVGSSEIRVFNSRLAISYPSRPEIFNDSFSSEDRSGQVVDINPADGQEITAAVPFFGSSAFGSAQLAQAVVVFKTNSIYLVDLPSNSYQKLQTQGQGCTAPRSVAVTKNGIFFANESGVYRLGTDYKIMWMGQALDGVWSGELDKSRIEDLAGHNYAQNRQYKLSYPLAADEGNSRAVVYDSAKEDLGKIGSWTKYDNHPSTGWCNLQDQAFFGSYTGRVYRIRSENIAADYRDDADPISQYAIFGGVNFGLPDERKIIESVTVQFQNTVNSTTDVKVLTEVSLSGTFNDSGTVSIPAEIKDATIRFSLPQRKGTHIRTQIEKVGVLDERLQISAVTYGVKSTGADGVPQSKKFRS
jgi:hypothetical protein